MARADWDLLQSLHAVLEAGTFSAAARVRGHSTQDPEDARIVGDLSLVDRPGLGTLARGGQHGGGSVS